jgi:biopolymer transport protein ExbD
MIARRRSRKKALQRGLLMTSVVDILTTMLFFLLQSFSSNGAIMCSAQDIELPVSSSTQGVSEGDLAIGVSEEGVSLGETMVVEGEELPEGGRLLLPPLAAALTETSAGRPDGRRVLVQGDRRVPFGVLYRVLFTCHQSGYPDLALAAIEKEPAGGGTP